jgi:cystathionine gamma-synthase
MKIETLAVHAGEARDRGHGAVNPPIYLSTSFERDPDGGYSSGHIYGRTGNPNRAALESCLAALEGGAACAAFSSGMAATSALFQTLASGDHVIVPTDAYFGTGAVLRGIFSRWGIEVSFADMADIAAVERELRPRTRVIWVETPSNPMMKLADIAAIAALAHRAGAICVCDNTFATPVLQRPLDHGADVVMHSTTKYLGGHGDLLGGALVLREDGDLLAAVREVQTQMGAVPSPFDCWLAMRVAEWLAAQPRVERVLYPGLPDHPAHDLARSQMRYFGGIISFLIEGEGPDALRIASRLRLFKHATSLGGVHSLIDHRASVEAPGSGTPANLLRLSIGLEHPDDLIDDLRQGLL